MFDHIRITQDGDLILCDEHGRGLHKIPAEVVEDMPDAIKLRLATLGLGCWLQKQVGPSDIVPRLVRWLQDSAHPSVIK